MQAAQKKQSLPTFRCAALHTTLSKDACGKRWRRAQDGQVFPESLDTCRRCLIGEGHATEAEAKSCA